MVRAAAFFVAHTKLDGVSIRLRASKTVYEHFTLESLGVIRVLAIIVERNFPCLGGVLTRCNMFRDRFGDAFLQNSVIE